jgi:hypothetical protein
VAIAAIFWAIAIGIGWVLLFVPGVILMVMFWVYVPAIVVENAGVTECFGRSRALTRGHRWGIFGMFLLLGVVIAGLELILFTQVEDVQAMAMAMTSGWMLWGISAVSVVITAYAAVLTSVGYYYLRAEKEGVLIEDIAKVFD